MSARGHRVHASYHKWMMQDEVRTEAMKRMVGALVKPGDVVADVGTGTGILAVLARRAGAARVHAIDASPIARLARQLIKDNGESEAIRVYEADAATVELPEPVDVIFSECMGNFAFGDAMFRALEAFEARWLKPGGRRGPVEVRLYLQPADSRLFWNPHRFWTKPWEGLDVSAFVPAEENRVPVVDTVPSFLWAEPSLAARFDPFRPEDSYTLGGEWEVEEGRLVTGVSGWFEVDWAPGVTLDTGPRAEGTHWSQVIFPMPHRVAGPGERLALQVQVHFDDRENPLYRWEGEWRDSDGAVLERFSRDMEQLFAAPD